MSRKSYKAWFVKPSLIQFYFWKKNFHIFWQLILPGSAYLYLTFKPWRSDYIVRRLLMMRQMRFINGLLVSWSFVQHIPNCLESVIFINKHQPSFNKKKFERKVLKEKKIISENEFLLSTIITKYVDRWSIKKSYSVNFALEWLFYQRTSNRDLSNWQQEKQ